MRLVCASGLFLALLHLSNSLLLGAFNIKAFGDKKASNTTLMNIISTVCTFSSFIPFHLDYTSSQTPTCETYKQYHKV